MATTKKRAKKDNWEGNIRERVDGRWEARIVINGKEKSIYGKNEAEVKRLLRNFKRLNSGNIVEVGKVAVQDYVYWFLLNCKFGYIKPTTFDRYESTYLNHIFNTKIGRKKLPKLTQSDIEVYLREKASPPTGVKALSKSSVTKILELLKMALTRAHTDRKIEVNPTTGVKVPVEETFEVETKEVEILEDNEILRLKNVIDNRVATGGRPSFKVGYACMVIRHSGMRCGELLALRESNIDLNRRIIKVNRNLVRVKKRDKDGTATGGNEYVIISTKTKNGKRILAMNDECFFYINKLLEYKREKNIKSDFLVCTDNGTHNTPRNLQRSFDSLLKRAQIDHYGIHALRHTFASVLFRNGVDVAIVSKILGHSSVKITYDRYIHIIEEQKAISMLKADNYNSYYGFDPNSVENGLYGQAPQTIMVETKNECQFDPNIDPNNNDLERPETSRNDKNKKKIILFPNAKSTSNPHKQWL